MKLEKLYYDAFNNKHQKLAKRPPITQKLLITNGLEYKIPQINVISTLPTNLQQTISQKKIRSKIEQTSIKKNKISHTSNQIIPQIKLHDIIQNLADNEKLSEKYFSYLNIKKLEVACLNDLNNIEDSEYLEEDGNIITGAYNKRNAATDESEFLEEFEKLNKELNEISQGAQELKLTEIQEALTYFQDLESELDSILTN